jgi:hypothetical protein
MRLERNLCAALAAHIAQNTRRGRLCTRARVLRIRAPCAYAIDGCCCSLQPSAGGV